MDGSFANQVLAQMYLYEQGFANVNDADKKKEMLTVKVLPKKLDEEVAELMVQGFGGTITKLTGELKLSILMCLLKVHLKKKNTNTNNLISFFK